MCVCLSCTIALLLPNANRLSPRHRKISPTSQPCSLAASRLPTLGQSAGHWLGPDSLPAPSFSASPLKCQKDSHCSKRNRRAKSETATRIGRSQATATPGCRSKSKGRGRRRWHRLNGPDHHAGGDTLTLAPNCWSSVRLCGEEQDAQSHLEEQGGEADAPSSYLTLHAFAPLN